MPTCRFSGKPFEITPQEKKCYEHFDLPLPYTHPMVRFFQKSIHVNAWSLYWAQNARTGEQILSGYDPKEHPVIYDNTYWMSGDFDPRHYGRAIEFSRPFFEQFYELSLAVPKSNLPMINCENMDYCNYCVNSKDCYLTFSAFESNHVFYSSRVFHSKDSIELFNSRQCEICFHCLNCVECYNTAYAEFCTKCTDSQFLYNCESCSNCYQCANLKHKQYCIQNKQYSKEEYEEYLRAINLRSYATLVQEQKKWEHFLEQQPLHAERLINCEHSDGVSMKNCKNCHFCYSLNNAENCYNCAGDGIKDSCDAMGYFGSEHIVGATGVINSQKCVMSFGIENSYNIAYSFMCFQSHDCFGCYGVRKADHCILNKSYTKHEYETLHNKLVAHMKETGEWGQWLPARYSHFVYEDTAVPFLFQELAGNKEFLKALGVRVGGKKDTTTDGEKVSAMPDMVDECDETVCAKTFLCAETGRPFKITRQELAFHKRLGIALPRTAWRTRIEKGHAQSFPFPREAHCGNCGKNFYSIADPAVTKRPLWCDACYREYCE